jgi:hypothetical protein
MNEDNEQHRVAGRWFFETLSERSQPAIRDKVMRELSAQGEDNPTPELVLASCRIIFVISEAQVREFLTDEIVSRYSIEERRRLSSEYFAGVPRDMLYDAVSRRAREEYPEAFIKD